MNLLLPTPVTRARLRAFTVAVSSVAACIVAPVLAVLRPGAAMVAGTTLPMVLLVGVGLARPYAVQAPYRAWNWAARRFLAAASTYVTAVCFHTVVQPARLVTATRRFDRRPEGTTTWRSRGSQTPAQYASQYHAPAPPSGRWIDPLRAWTDAAGRPEARALVPFLVLLRALDPEPEDSTSPVPTNIYTLY